MKTFTRYVLLILSIPGIVFAEDTLVLSPSSKLATSKTIRPENISKLGLKNPLVSPAQELAYAGHGRVFDKDMREIELTPAKIKQLQDAILNEVTGTKPLPSQLKSANFMASEKLLATPSFNEEEKLAIKSNMINSLLKTSPKEQADKYDWRNRVLLQSIFKIRPADKLNPEILKILKGGILTSGLQTTDYMKDCKTHQVPIPPNWAETGTAWVLQGKLNDNLLQPGNDAFVWTYSDPNVPGACVALPREDGAAGSPAGIICQSATTGYACFWDNKLRGVEPESFIGWKNKTLVINQLKDGSNLNAPCTGCHIGNNVFLLAPQDPTWQKVLNNLAGVRTGKFSTRINNGNGPRYTPITTLPERANWQNPVDSDGVDCAQMCHEKAVVKKPASMPPNCGNNACYAPGLM